MGMKPTLPNKARVVLLILVAFLPLAFVTPCETEDIALAQSGRDHSLSWWTVDGGGQSFSNDGRYSLGGTIGQPDAAVVEGGGYTLIGGFWAGALVEYRCCLPLVLRSY